MKKGMIVSAVLASLVFGVTSVQKPEQQVRKIWLKKRLRYKIKTLK